MDLQWYWQISQPLYCYLLLANFHFLREKLTLLLSLHHYGNDVIFSYILIVCCNSLENLGATYLSSLRRMSQQEQLFTPNVDRLSDTSTSLATHSRTLRYACSQSVRRANGLGHRLAAPTVFI